MIEVSHVGLWYDLQGDLKFQGMLHMKSFRIRGQSSVNDKFGLKALDHLCLFPLIFFLLGVL